MMTDSTLEFLAQSQADMASSMSKIADSVSEMKVSHARMDERIIRMIDDKQRVDITLEKHGRDIEKINVIVKAGKFVGGLGYRIALGYVASVGLGGSAVYAFLEVAGAK